MLASPVDSDLVHEFWARVDRVVASRPGMTYQRLAGRLGVTASALSMMRSGQRVTPLDVAIHVARVLRAPDVLGDALAALEDGPAPEVEEPLKAGRELVGEFGHLLVEWTAAAQDDRLTGTEARDLLVRLERLRTQEAQLRAALVEIVNGGRGAA